MTDKTTPAFPNPALANEAWSAFDGAEGMSIRDWFAGQFLAGCAAAPDMSNDSNVVASAAYNYADAMMEARKK